MRSISPIGLELIKSFESLRLTAYRCPAGVWTIGYGHTRRVRPQQHITAEEAEVLLLSDLQVYQGAVLRLISVGVNDNQYAALVSLCYNIGETNFARSSVLRYTNHKDWRRAAANFALWNRGGGRLLPGLIRRRAAETKLFLTPA